MKKEYFPGWLLMAAVAVGATLLSNLVVVEGKHPLEAAFLAVLLGMILQNVRAVPRIFQPGIKANEKILILGIVLLGASLNFKDFGSQGPRILVIILATMAVSFIVIFLLAKAFGLTTELSLLLTVGTTICGTSAIAVTAPLIKAKEEETAYAIGTITLWGLAAILIYPKVAQLLGATDLVFGVFAGTSIHATPQVVGAGFIFSETAGKTATAVKLVRNCFIAPLAILIALWYARLSLKAGLRHDQGLPGSRAAFLRAFPWFLFGYFLMAGFNSLGFFTAAGVRTLGAAGKYLILIAMAGIGLNTVFSMFKKVGFKPLVVGLLGAVVVAGASLGLITLLL